MARLHVPRRVASAGPLRNADLRLLVLGFAALTLSEWSYVTALSIHAFRVGGTLAVGLIGLRLLAGGLSSALISPLAARRPSVLSEVTLVRAGLFVAGALLVLANWSYALVLVVVVVDSVVAAAYRPAQSRRVPSLARSPQEVSQAAVWISITNTLGQTIGAPVGALIAAVVSPGAAMLGASAVMLVALVCSRLLGAASRPAGPRSTGMLRAGLEAFPLVLRDRHASPLVVASVLRTLERGLWSALLLIVALRLLRIGASGVGLLQLAAGIGAIAAVPITSVLTGRGRLAATCGAAFVGAGLVVVALGAVPATIVALATMVGYGTTMAVSDAASLSLLHRLLPAGELSRAVGVMESLKLGAGGVGSLLAPALVALFGTRLSLVCAGLPLPILVALTSRRLHESDERVRGRDRTVALLHRVSPFRGLDMATIEDAAARVEPITLAAGATIITQGEPGDRFYVLASGEVEVLLETYPIGRIRPPGGFGERALLYDSARTASVRAVTDVELLSLERSQFLAAVIGPEAAEYVPNAAEPAARSIPELVGRLTALSFIPREGIEAIAAQAVEKRYEAGTAIIREGDESTAIYVLLSGRAEATANRRPLNVLRPGDAFGEIGVLHDLARTATVTATEPATVLVIPASAVRAVAVSGALMGSGG